MLVIRLQRTGRKNLPAYRIVVAEKSKAVKKGYVDLVGHYLPAQNPKVIEIDHEKVKAWISKGAIPSDTVASLCKHDGLDGMEKYIDPRNKKAKKKKEVPEEEPKAAPAPAAEESAPEAPQEEPTPAEEAPVEEPAVEEKAEETPAETPAEEEKKEEEPAQEEAPAEQPEETEEKSESEEA